MPKEKITSTSKFNTHKPEADTPPGSQVANLNIYDLAVGWNNAGRWVQLNVMPKGWQDTGEWISFDLDGDEIDHLIRSLRRAKRRALN